MEKAFTIDKSHSIVTCYGISSATHLLKRSHLEGLQVVPKARSVLDVVIGEMKRKESCKATEFYTDVLYDENQVYIDGVEEAYFVETPNWLQEFGYGSHLCEKKYLSSAMSAAAYCTYSFKHLADRRVSAALAVLNSEIISENEAPYITEILDKTTATFERYFTSLEPLLDYMLSLEEDEHFGDFREQISGLSIDEALRSSSNVYVLKLLRDNLSRSTAVKDTVAMVPEIESASKRIALYARK